jgi:hypothetical protein
MSFLKEHAISNPVVAGVSAAAPKEKGLFSTIMDNLAGGAESVIGGGLDYIGAQLKRFDEAGRESSYVDSIRNSDEGTLGKWGDSFINNGEYLNDKAAKNFAESGTLDKYQDMSIIDRLTSADYLTDKRGLLADFSQMAGSAIPFAAASAAAPFGGAGALAARGIGSMAARAGAKQIGKAIMSKAGQQAGASAAKWALGTGPLEAATNAGDMYADLKDEGLSDDEIARRMNSMIQEELPMDMLTQGIMGPILEGKGFKPIFKRGGRAGKIAGYGVNIPGSAASEYAQEMTQQQAQNKWSGKPYGTFFNPTEDEQQAGRAAFMGSLPLGLFGAGHTAYRDYKARINRMNNEAAKSNPNNPFNGMEETAGNKTEIADVPESTVTVQRGNANNGGSDKEAFFNAIEMQESGGDPDAVSSTGARGVYQIQPENWDAWSKEAGLGGASMDDDDAYRQVGRFKMGQYFDEYGPEGALVAWYSGPNNAQRWVEGEATDQNGRPWDAPQGNGPSIAGYVNSAMGHFADEKAQSPALDIPQTADYTISGEVSNPNLTDLTEQKLRLLDRDYYNQYGRHFYITSMARNGGGESWHDSAQAFDTADDFLEGNADARNWLIDKAKEYGLYGLDEYSNPSANATGGHLHFSDHGEALNGSGGSYNITVPGFNLSQYDLTPEQEKANMEAAQALISNNEVTPEQQQSVMEMATQLMNMPVSDDVNEDAAHAAAMQNAIDGGDIGAIFKMHPQETANAMMKPVMAAKAPSPRRAPATPKIDNINPQAPAQTRVSTNYGNRFAQTVDDITKLASQGKIAEAALVARSNGWNNTMVNLLTQGVNASAGNIQNAIMNGIQLDVPNAFPALPEGQGLAGNIKNNQQHISIANLEELASIANNNPQYAAAQATQQNLPTTASAIMQSAMNGQPIDSGLLDSTIQQDLNNKQKQANANRQVIDARMQKAGLATNPATPNAGIIVPNGAPAGTPDIVIPDTPKRKAPIVNTNDLMARLNDSPVFRQAKAKGDIGAMANEADAMGFHKEAEQIRNSQYGNVPSKFDYKKRLSEVKKMSRADRIELGKELLNELEAKNIPVNDNLRNDLEHGVPKAIVNAEKKLANAETNDEAEQKVKPAEEATPAIANNEAAENVPEQDDQEVKAEKSAKEDTVLKGVSGIYESDIKDYIDRGYNIESYRGHLENGKPVYNLDFETSKDKARFVKDFYGESEGIDTDTSEPDYAKELDKEQEKKAEAEPVKEGNKKATNEGGYKLADGYKTESGKPINEADEREFIVKPDGSKDFGEISQAISKAVKEQSGIELNTGKIRLRVGNEKEGLIHAKKHEQQAKDDGYNSIEDMIADVASSFDEIYLREPDNEHGNSTYSLIKRGNKAKGKMNGVEPVYFEMQDDGKGNYYIVLSVMPMGDKNVKRNIAKKDRLIYSSPGLDTATISNDGAVSHVSLDVGADTHGGYPTSDKSSGSSTSNISQEQKPSKGKVKQKETERAGTEGNETVAEGNGGEVSSEHTQGTETVQSEPVVKEEKPKEEKKHRIFSTQEEAEKELEKALGIRPVKKKAEEKPAKEESKDESDGNKPKDIDPKKFAGVDISEEAETKLVAELKQALEKSRNRLNSLPVFDPDILAPAFKLGRLYVARGAKGFTEFAKTMIDTLGDDIRGWLHPVWSMLESADGKVDESQMIPAFNYVGSVMEKNPKASFEDIRNEFAEKYGEDNAKDFEPLLKLGFIGADNVINNPKEVTDSELYDSTNKPAERNSAGNNQDAMGTVHEDGESRTGRGQSVQSSGKEVRSQRSGSVHGRSTDTSGKTGNSRVQSEETKQSAGNDSTGAEHLSRSIRDSFDRPPVDDGRSAESIKSVENRPVNESSKRGAINGAKVDKKNFKTGSKKQIEASMPFLMKGQVDDVVKADNRLFSTDKNGKPYKGMMFTNGTGTGKTFTGLGVIKRFVQRGKKNILIIAPQDKTQNDWINAGKGFFGLDISKLKSTKDKGEGIVITSYQNVGENNALLERDWDLIVTDESHKLMQGEQANNTNALNKVRAMTYHNRGFNDYYEAKNYDNVMQERSLNSRAGASDFTASDRQQLADLHVKNERIRHKLKAEYEAMQAEDAKGANDRHKVLFLSATPFAYIKNIEYAEGYLFDYPAKEKHGYYNDTDGQEQFMIDHFGYRMRNNKLNKPDAEVNQDIMEIKFNEWLKSIGAVSSRKLEVKPDYERGYILVDGGVGKQIDRGLDILHGNDEKGDRDKYSLIAKMVDEKLKKNGRRYLLEAVKAKAAIPIIKEYLKAGKQVVVFHDFKKNEAANPFMLISDDFAELDPSDQAKAHKQYEDFCAENPELLKLDMKDLMSPIERFQSELGKTVGIFNGDVKKSLRQDSVDKFNDDEDDLRVLLCQRASAKEGISLHDRTGKHQRVLIDLGLATRPTDLIQCEGRIYRTGVVTNAIIRYLNTGMNFERQAFADTIAGRSSTAENLSMGYEARNLRDAIVNGFMESIDGDTWKRYLPNSKTEGTGGKARDGKAMSGVSQFDEAVSDYFTNAKKNSRNKSSEGVEYYPTPEPVGFKMVEWLGLKNGNKALEPSAGHGAISRYFSATTRNTIIEPSEQLATLAKMRLKGGTTSRVETTTFEQFAKANKFDGIAMNPPYGKGGKTAMEHLAKAFEHLYDGGRVIAIVPDGPAFNKRFDEWYGNNEAKHALLINTIRLPQCTFKRAGTSVATKILVIDKYLTDEDMKQAQGGNEVDLRGIENIKDLFSRIKNMTMPERIGADIKNHFTNTVNKKSINNSYMALVDDVKLMNDDRLYAIAFDYQGRRNVKFGGYGFATESLRNKFERTANKYLAEKANNPNAKVPTTESKPAENTESEQYFTLGTHEDTRPNVDKLYSTARPTEYLSDKYRSISNLAKEHNGHYSKYANNSFIFENENDRNEFVKEANALLAESNYSISPADNVKEQISEQAKAQAMGRLRTEIAEALPTAKNIRDDGSSLYFTMFNKAEVEIQIADELNVDNGDADKARKAHGLEAGVKIKVNGKEYTVGSKAVIQLALNGDEGSVYHEVFHAVWDMVLTDKEKSAIIKAYKEDARKAGKDVIEYAADRYRDWFLARNKGVTKDPNGNSFKFGKLWKKFREMVDKLRSIIAKTEEVNRIFKDIESGKVWERELDNALKVTDNDIKQMKQELAGKLKPDMTDDELDQAFLGTKIVRELRSKFNFDMNGFPKEAYEYSRRFNRLGEEFERYVSDNRQNNVKNRAIKDGGTPARYDKRTPDNADRRSEVEVEKGYTGGVRELNARNQQPEKNVSYEVQSVLYLNDVKAIHDYEYDNNKLSVSRSDKDGFSSTQKYSISEMQTETEPAGSLNRIKKSMSELGKIATEKNVEIRKKKERDIDNLNMLDMWVKTVRQVSKKNNAVKYFYNLARKAYDEQEKLRAHYGEAMKRFNQYTKDKKDLDDVSQALLQGDMEGKEYKVKDLKEMGLSDNAIRAYKLVRLRLGSAYKLINDARMQVIERNKILHRSQLDDFKKAHFLKDSDILSIINKGNGKILVTYRGAKIYEHTGEMVSPEALSKLKADKDVCVIDFEPVTDDLGTTLWRVDYTERPKPLTKLTGYVPHFFHKFMVYQKYTNEDGEEILVTRGSGRSLKEAAKLANGYAKENPDSEYVIRAQGFEYDEEYNNVVVGDRDFARMTSQIHKNTDMSLNEARKFLRESAGAKIKGRHRFFGNMKKRKGAEGFEKDVPWLLEHYFNASSRYVAMEHWKPQAISTYERWFGDFNAEPKTDIARYIKNHINDMNGVPSRFEKLLNKSLEKTALGQRLSDYYNGRPALALSSNFSSFIAVVKLGLGNFASAAINFMQFVNIGTKLNSYKWAMEGLKRALKPNKLDRRILKNSGVMNEITLADNSGGYSHNRDSGRVRNVLGNIKRAANKTMLPFTMADSLMRKAAILGAYYQGVTEKGMKPEPGKTISKKAMQYAKEVNFDANFDYSNVATPGVMRAGSVLTQQMFQFQKYPIMQLEFMWNNVVHAENNAQRARFLVPYMLLAGAAGALPFGDLLNEFFSFLFGIYTGKDENLADECKAAMMKWAGNDPASKKLVETVIYGIPALAGIDISGRVGMSGAFSGKYYGTAPSSAAGAIANALGGPVLGTAFNTIDQLHNGNPAEAIKAISPALGNMIQAWVNGASYGTHHRVNSVYEDGFAKVIHGLGFRSTDESNTSFINSYLYDMRSRYGDEKKDAMDAYRKDKTSENKRAMQDLGITDKQFKRYESDSNRSAQERAQKEWHTKKKPTAKEAQLLHDAKALKDFVQ